MEQNNFALGAIQSPEDERQFTASSVGASVVTPTICIMDIVEKMRVSMQASIGSCVGCTGEEGIRKIIFQATGVQPEELSWRFVYALAKCLEGTPGFEQWGRTAGANDGTYPSLVTYILRHYGVPSAKFCPNDTTLSPDDFCYGRNIANIPAVAFTDALNRKGGNDLTFPISVEGIKQAIVYASQNNGAVMILRRIGDTYWMKNGISTWKKSDLFPMPLPKTITGGHEELLYGYEVQPNGKTLIKWLNHWSDSWGSTTGNRFGTDPQSHDGGFGTEYLEDWIPNIGEVRVFVPAIPVVPPVDTFKYTFNKDMKLGDKSGDVLALQHALKINGEFPASQIFTGNFGPITFQAVKDFQQKYASEVLTPGGLINPTGYVGSYTRAKLNKLFS